jgi:hypothetical protein
MFFALPVFTREFRFYKAGLSSIMGYGRSRLIAWGVAMQALKRTLPLFFILGLISGVACWAQNFVLPEKQWINDYYPALVLGFFVHAAGAHAAGMTYSRRVPALVALLIASMLGWRLAIEVGHDLGGPAPFVNAGALGALVIALGLLLVWYIRSLPWKIGAIILMFLALAGLAIFPAVKFAIGALVIPFGLALIWRAGANAWKFAVLITVAGALGGLIFNILDTWFIGSIENDDLWVLILFAEWQAVFMAGLALALHYGVRK